MLNLFKRRKKLETMSSVPQDEAEGYAYVIGDIHGCYDELNALLALIEADARTLESGPKFIVFLGDLMDRGPKSNEVIDRLMNFKPDFAELIFLMGNHEEMFLKILSGETRSLPSWFEFGGRATARSYGVENLGVVHTNPASLVHQLKIKVPDSHAEFLKSFQSSFLFGPYFCVHAGIRPKVAIEDQRERDFRWIRKEFLNYKDKHPYIIVHGHSIVEEVALLPNRIAVDTGAYNGGPLTAIRLSAGAPHIIQTEATREKGL